MDTQDFDVTVRETLEHIDRSIEYMALDGVECYPGDTALRLEFGDMAQILLEADSGRQVLTLRSPHTAVTLAWSPVEEQWIDRDGPLDLFRILSREMGRHLGAGFVLRDAE